MLVLREDDTLCKVCDALLSPVAKEAAVASIELVRVPLTSSIFPFSVNAVVASALEPVVATQLSEDVALEMLCSRAEEIAAAVDCVLD